MAQLPCQKTGHANDISWNSQHVPLNLGESFHYPHGWRAAHSIQHFRACWDRLSASKEPRSCFAFCLPFLQEKKVKIKCGNKKGEGKARCIAAQGEFCRSHVCSVTEWPVTVKKRFLSVLPVTLRRQHSPSLYQQWPCISFRFCSPRDSSGQASKTHVNHSLSGEHSGNEDKKGHSCV